MSVEVTELSFDYSRAGDACYLRFYAETDFVDADGVFHPAQPAGGQDYLTEVECAVSGGIAVAEDFTLPATWDAATNTRATLTAYVLDTARRKAFVLAAGVRILANPATQTWRQILLYNDDQASLRDLNVYTKPQVNLLLADTIRVYFEAFAARTLGRATLLNGSAVVLTPAVASDSKIILSARSENVTGVLAVTTITPGVSFTIRSTNAGDNGDVSWAIFRLPENNAGVVATGIATLIDGEVTVSAAETESDSEILLSARSGEVTGALYPVDITEGMGFTIRSTEAGDNGDVSWVLTGD